MKEKYVKKISLIFMIFMVFAFGATKVFAIEIVDENQKKFEMSEVRISGTTTDVINVGQELEISAIIHNFNYMEKIQYEYSYIKDSETVMIKPFSENKTCAWKPETPGIYFLTIAAKNEKGEIAKKSRKITVINSQRLEIKTINTKPKSEELETGNLVTIEPVVIGGTQPYQYNYTIQDSKGEVVETKTTSESKYEWTPQKQDSYNINIEVRDTGGQIISSKVENYIVKPNEQERSKIRRSNIFIGIGALLLAVSILIGLIIVTKKIKEKFKKE